jgi:hypothetical protein
MVENSKEQEFNVVIAFDKIDVNPSFILASILREKRFPLEWKDEEKWIKIRVDWNSWMQFCRTPEYHALDHAWTCHSPRSQLRQCSWDEDTKRKIFAFYWSSVAKSCKDFANKTEDLSRKKGQRRK